MDRDDSTEEEATPLQCLEDTSEFEGIDLCGKQAHTSQVGDADTSGGNSHKWIGELGLMQQQKVELECSYSLLDDVHMYAFIQLFNQKYLPSVHARYYSSTETRASSAPWWEVCSSSE